MLRFLGSACLRLEPPQASLSTLPGPNLPMGYRIAIVLSATSFCLGRLIPINHKLLPSH